MSKLLKNCPCLWSANAPYRIHVFLKFNLENCNLIWNQIYLKLEVLVQMGCCMPTCTHLIIFLYCYLTKSMKPDLLKGKGHLFMDLQFFSPSDSSIPKEQYLVAAWRSGGLMEQIGPYPRQRARPDPVRVLDGLTHCAHSEPRVGFSWDLHGFCTKKTHSGSERVNPWSIA